jgi:hypothetical protein
MGGVAESADIRDCEQCGTSFVPRREHARFCCVRCRVAWNREHMGDPAAGTSALVWSITAMSEAAERLARVTAANRPQAFTVIREAVWWVTIVDATLVRHYPAGYDSAMAGQVPAERKRAEATMAGLRFVRNRIGDQADLAELVEAGEARPDTGQEPITGWTWRPAREPELASLPPRGRAWETTRYRAYQAQLAGRTIGDTFGRATAFLELAAAGAPAITDADVQAGR